MLREALDLGAVVSDAADDRACLRCINDREPGSLSDVFRERHKLSAFKPERDHAQFTPARAAHVTFYRGGGLVTVARSKPGGPRRRVGGPRSTITTFTRASRRRLMRTVARVRKSALPVFVTLTYPGEYSDDPTVWKRDLKVFWQRMARRFPRAAFVWRLEFQRRGAPHFHLLVWGVRYAELRAFVPVAWYEVVGSGDDKHLRAGTRVEHIRSHNQVLRYAAKELGKVVQVTLTDVGRWWGVVGREHRMPWSVAVPWPITDRDAIQYLRWLRRLAGVRARAYKSLTVFADGSFWEKKLRGPPGDFLTWSTNVTT